MKFIIENEVLSGKKLEKLRQLVKRNFNDNELQIRTSYENTDVTIRSESVNISAPVIKVREKHSDICAEFNRTIDIDVRTCLTRAFCELAHSCKEGHLPYSNRKEIYEKEASRCKTLLNKYIDLLVEALLKDDWEKDVE